MSFLSVSLWAAALCYLVGLVSGGVLGRIGVASLYLEVVVGAVAMLLAFVFYKYSLNQGFSVLKWTRSDSLQTPISLGWLVTALAMTILMSASYYGWILSATEIDAQRHLPPPEPKSNLLSFALVFLNTVILAAIWEEVVMRGMLMQALKKRFNFFIAVLGNSLLFGAMHFRPGWTVYLVLVGVFLSVIAMRSQCLWPAIMAHALLNLQSIGRSQAGYGGIATMTPYASESNVPLFAIGVVLFFCAAVFAAWRVRAQD